MALIVGIKHQLEFGYHIFHALAALLIACGRIDGKGRQIMSAHMSVQSIPIGIRRFAGYEVTDYRTARERYGEMVVLLCFGTHRREVMAQIAALAAEQELYAPDVPVAGKQLFTMEYAARHRKELEQVYGILADEQSRRVLRQVVEYKLTGKIAPLLDCQTEPEEAWRNILRLTGEERYLDLGAYTGDTIADFIGQVGTWRSITALEPDPASFARLEQNTAGLHDCVLYRLGAYSRYARLPFAGTAGRGSRLAPQGTLAEWDSVDNILCGQPVSYVKIDVEGQESAALAGTAPWQGSPPAVYWG